MSSHPVLLVTLLASSALAQSWNPNAGGWSTGYGTVYGSFGMAMATQNIYDSMRLNMQRSMMRSAMIKKHGLAAVEKAERDAKAGRSVPQGMQVTAPLPRSKHLGAFKPAKGAPYSKQLGDALGTTAEEKRAITQISIATREAFEAQPETQRWKNDVAGALAFFLIGNLTVAADAPEPGDEESQALFQAISLALDATPEVAKASAKDKQQLYDTLIGFTGLPLALYTDAKERGDAKQLAQARELSSRLLELVFKQDASKLKLTE